MSCLQRATRLQGGVQGGLQSEAEPRAREAREAAEREASVREACGCSSLRCALRPLLALAMLEAFYSSIPPAQLEEGMRQAKRDGTLRPLAEAAGPDADQILLLLDTMRPEDMLDAAQQALRELVQLGVVRGLG